MFTAKDLDEIASKMISSTRNDRWIAGAFCEVYSQQKWVKAQIIEIFVDDEGEWVKVKCGRSILEIPSKDPSLRLYESAKVRFKHKCINALVLCD